MKKVLSVLLVLLIALSVVSSQADNTPVICDDAELLSEDEKSELEQAMNPICSFGIPVFWTTNQVDSTDTLAKAKDYLLKAVDDNEGVIFVIDMYNRELVICSTDQIFQRVTTSQANRILDNVYKMATADEYLKCAQATYAAILEVLNKSDLSENREDNSSAVDRAETGSIESIDLTALSVEDLIKLKDEAESELLHREGMIVIPPGDYLVGRDIASGTYTISAVTFKTNPLKTINMGSVWIYCTKDSRAEYDYARSERRNKVKYAESMKEEGKEAEYIPEIKPSDYYLFHENLEVGESVRFTLEDGQLLELYQDSYFPTDVYKFVIQKAIGLFMD